MQKRGTGNNRILKILLKGQDWPYSCSAARASSRAEELERQFADFIPDIVYTFDLTESRFVHVNAYATKFFGFSSAEIMNMGYGFLTKRIHPSDVSSLQNRELFFASADEADVMEFEVRMRSSTGEWRWLRARETLFSRNREGKPHVVLGIARDVTDEKALQNELLEMRTREQNQLGHELHDVLGQSLASIALMAKSLEKSSGKGPIAIQAREIVELTNRAMGQARALAHGLSAVELRRGGLADALRQLAVNAERAYKIACQIEIDENVQLPDNVIALNLFHIAQEAVKNAVHYSKACRVTIRLNTSNDGARLEVSDDGPAQGGRSRSMGLSVMKYYADSIGARLSTASEAEKGTTVVCQIT